MQTEIKVTPPTQSRQNQGVEKRRDHEKHSPESQARVRDRLPDRLQALTERALAHDRPVGASTTPLCQGGFRVPRSTRQLPRTPQPAYLWTYRAPVVACCGQHSTSRSAPCIPRCCGVLVYCIAVVCREKDVRVAKVLPLQAAAAAEAVGLAYRAGMSYGAGMSTGHATPR